MKNSGWQWQGKGEPKDVLQLREIPLPVVGKDEVLIRNTMVGLNPVDWKLIVYGPPTWQSGQVPGVDGAGTIVSFGAENLKQKFGLSEGQRVCYHTNLRSQGSFATYTAVKAKVLLALPQGVSDELGATFSCPVMTAVQAVNKLPPVSAFMPHQARLLVSGASSVVGRSVIQIALSKGWSVDGLTNYDHDVLRQLGLETIYKSEDEITTSYEAVIDLRSEDSATRLAHKLAYNGHIVAVVGRVGSAVTDAFTTCYSYHELALGAINHFGRDEDFANYRHEGYFWLNKLSQSTFKLTYPYVGDFSNLAEEMQSFKDSHTHLKVVLKLPSE